MTQTDAVLASDGSVVYGSDSGTSSIVVQGFTNGLRISTTLASKEAGASFSYPLDLQKGSRIEVQGSGGVLIIGPDGSLLGGLLAPWAKDANGASVPTHYEVHGSSVVQVINGDPAALAYPVVADPYWFIDLIDHFSWSYTSGPTRLRWTLSVWPTPWAIFNSGKYSVAEYGWEELVHKDTNHTINTNIPGMHDQYDCHQILFVGVIRLPSGAVYHLDEWRRYEGLAQTMIDQCNPPIAW